MAQSSDKERFKEVLNYLYEGKGISLSKISDKAMIDYQKLRSIRAGRSHGDGELLQRLYITYPELLNAGKPEPDKIEKRVEELESEMKRKESEIAEMRKILLKLANKILDQK